MIKGTELIIKLKTENEFILKEKEQDELAKIIIAFLEKKTRENT